MSITSMNIMPSDTGAFIRFLVTLCFFFLPVFHLIYVNGEGNICKLQATGNCTNAIIMIDKKSAEEETSFNVYIYQQGKKEFVAMLSYENVYICHQTTGYTCTSLADGTFNVNLGFAPLQNVTLVGDGQQPVKCQCMEPTSDPPLESAHNSEDNNCDCQHKRESGNSVYHSRQKRCACPNASPENPDGNPNIGKADDNGGEVDNPKENESLVPIIVISLISAVLAAVVVVLLRYRKQMVLWWKKNRNEHIDKENADTKDPLNTESTKC